MRLQLYVAYVNVQVIQFELDVSERHECPRRQQNINMGLYSLLYCNRNSKKNYSTGTKFDLNLRILMMNQHFEFQCKIHDRDNERKPLINRNFLSLGGINLTGTKFKLDLRILNMYLHSEYQFKMSMHD